MKYGDTQMSGERRQRFKNCSNMLLILVFFNNMNRYIYIYIYYFDVPILSSMPSENKNNF